MKYEEKIEILLRYRDAEKSARYYRQEVEQYKATQEQAKIQRVTGMPTAHGNNRDLSDYIVKLSEMETEMYSRLEIAENLKLQIMIWIEMLKNVDERLVLQYKYLQCHNTGWIADEMHYSPRTVERKHYKAVMHLPEPDKVVAL